MYNEISASVEYFTDHRSGNPEEEGKVCALPCTDISMFLQDLYRGSLSF